MEIVKWRVHAWQLGSLTTSRDQNSIEEQNITTD